jgi:hypothetical protein
MREAQSASLFFRSMQRLNLNSWSSSNNQQSGDDSGFEQPD